MSLLARVRPSRPEAPAPPAPAAVLADAELGDEELEQVVGGLERVFIPGMTIAQG